MLQDFELVLQMHTKLICQEKEKNLNERKINQTKLISFN